MSERKVLNKYYPPDFDPSKIPKLRLPRNRQYSIRVMAPFNMRCNTCGEYIYKGKKFNSRKETVEEETYLGLHIFRFYIKCPRCVSEIAFKTDPQNTDYELEGGAVRNFEALRTAEMMARKEAEEKEAEEANNPMKLLEKRTKASQQEMEMIETLEDLRNVNSRNAKLDLTSMTEKYRAYEEMLAKLQEEEDENIIKSIFGKSDDDDGMKRLPDNDDDEEEDVPVKKIKKSNDPSQKPTDLLTQGSEQASSSKSKKTPAVWEKSVGSLSTNKKTLGSLVKKKTGNSSEKTIVLKPGNEIKNSSGPSSDHSSSNGPSSSGGSVTSAVSSSEVKPGSQDTKPSTTTPAPSALGLLGSYSDSESDQSD